MESADGYIECIRYTEFKHPEYPFLCVHPDMLVIGDGQKPYLVQAKTHKYFFLPLEKKRGKTFQQMIFSFRGLPLFTYFQIQFEMLIADVDTCFVELESDNSFLSLRKRKRRSKSKTAKRLKRGTIPAFPPIKIYKRDCLPPPLIFGRIAKKAIHQPPK